MPLSTFIGVAGHSFLICLLSLDRLEEILAKTASP